MIVPTLPPPPPERIPDTDGGTWVDYAIWAAAVVFICLAMVLMYVAAFR